MDLLLNCSLHTHLMLTFCTKALMAGAAALLSPERKAERSIAIVVLLILDTIP